MYCAISTAPLIMPWLISPVYRIPVRPIGAQALHEAEERLRMWEECSRMRLGGSSAIGSSIPGRTAAGETVRHRQVNGSPPARAQYTACQRPIRLARLTRFQARGGSA